ncbi:MAG: AglZ/HisF2 family acetamidino modification protein [Alsobacter sp.]
MTEPPLLPPLQLPPLRPRVIPVLLIKDGLLYKPLAFRNARYVGDPRVAVKIFNDKGADELLILDISATPARREPDYGLIEEIASESFMPLGYGGGIRSVDQAARLAASGVEKVVLNTAAVETPALIEEVSDLLGASSTVVCIDAKAGLFGGPKVYVHGGTRSAGVDPVTLAQQCVRRGAGEIVIQDIAREGAMKGYNLQLIRSVSSAVDVPIVALGGAGSPDDFRPAIEAGAAAVGAGSMFVFQGTHRAVLITYPPQDRLDQIFGTG